MQSLKILSRGTDFTLGPGKAEHKRYDYYGSGRYANPKEKVKPTSYSVFQNPF